MFHIGACQAFNEQQNLKKEKISKNCPVIANYFIVFRNNAWPNNFFNNIIYCIRYIRYCKILFYLKINETLDGLKALKEWYFEDFKVLHHSQHCHLQSFHHAAQRLIKHLTQRCQSQANIRVVPLNPRQKIKAACPGKKRNLCLGFHFHGGGYLEEAPRAVDEVSGIGGASVANQWTHARQRGNSTLYICSALRCRPVNVFKPNMDRGNWVLSLLLNLRRRIRQKWRAKRGKRYRVTQSKRGSSEYLSYLWLYGSPSHGTMIFNLYNFWPSACTVYFLWKS